MKRLATLLSLVGVSLCVMVFPCAVMAQDQAGGGRGQRGPGFGDPAQFQERLMEQYREALGFTDQSEWDAVKPLVQKVLDAQREAMPRGGMRMLMRRGPGGDQGGAGGPMRRMFQPSPAEEALQKAIDSNASKEELKAAMEKVREERRQKEAQLKAAREELKKVLSVKQEAVALQLGLID